MSAGIFTKACVHPTKQPGGALSVTTNSSCPMATTWPGFADRAVTAPAGTTSLDNPCRRVDDWARRGTPPVGTELAHEKKQEATKLVPFGTHAVDRDGKSDTLSLRPMPDQWNMRFNLRSSLRLGEVEPLAVGRPGTAHSR